jgi:FkbM family methyltransferase
MDSALAQLGIQRPSYIDIGANHPILGNNTYLFYSRGARGVCVEPNPELFRVLKRTRTGDVCLQAGVGPVATENADFYMMSSTPLGTFLQNVAEENTQGNNYGKQAIRGVFKMPLVTINSIMEKYFKNPADIVSVDAEGYDFEILKSLDLKKYRPKIICAETLRFDESGKVQKQRDIIEYLEQSGYVIFADTNVNTIFLDKAYAHLIH